MANIMKQRRATGANWTSNNPILYDGQIGIEKDSTPPKMKFGDGTTHWNDLPYADQGTKGDAGPAGVDGVSVTSASKTTGELIFRMSNNTEINVGSVDGRSISSTAFVPGSGHLIITYSDTTTQDVGKVAGDGSGDMLKSVYDTALRGYVDRAVLADTIANNAATDNVIGDRTITDGTLLTGYTGKLTTLLTGFATLLKDITGKSNAYTSPDASIAGLWAQTWAVNYILTSPAAGFVSQPIPIPRNATCNSIKFFPQGTPSSETSIYAFQGQSITIASSLTAAATTATTNTTMTGTVPFYAVIDSEVVQVTAISGTTITIARGQLSTTAATHASGSIIAPTIGNVSLSASTSTALALDAVSVAADDIFYYAVSGAGLSTISVTIEAKLVNRS